MVNESESSRETRSSSETRPLGSPRFDSSFNMVQRARALRRRSVQRSVMLHARRRNKQTRNEAVDDSTTAELC